MKAYLAGKMQGVPQFNYPAFDAAAEMLRAQGHTIISPAELDDPKKRATALASPDGAFDPALFGGETWGDFLARDLRLIADSGLDAIVVLPNWPESRGANLETFAGKLCKLPVLNLDGSKVPAAELAESWARWSLV